MRVVEFLSYLRSLDIQVFVDRDREAAPEEVRLRCNAPQGALTPEIRAELAKRKAEVISFLRQANVTESTSSINLVPISRKEGTFLLSFAQQRLWFLSQLDPDSAFYNIPFTLRLSGSLNYAALKQSLNEIIRRHETLRTNFITVEGQPVAIIAATLSLVLPVVNLRSLPESSRLVDIQRLAAAQGAQPFDLASEPLIRASLLQLSEVEHVLLLCIHHIAFDGWSIGVLVRELAALYKAYCKNLPSPLPELPIQYVDFARWQRQWLQGEVLSSQLTYWKQQLQGAPAVLELPSDRPRSAVQTFQAAYHTFALSQPLTQELTTLSQQQGVTLFMTLLAAFQTLLYRYSGQDDICVGTPIANRNRAEIEGLIGFFVNTLVLRIDLGGNPSFEQLLSRVRDVAVGAYAHQDLPFEQLVDQLQPERSLSHTPLFQVTFALQNAPVPELELPDLTVSLTANPLSLESSVVKPDLMLSLENTKQGLSVLWEYNSDLFDTATMTRMAGHFQSLLEGIVSNPQQKLSELPMLSAAERHQLLVEWNNTQADYPKQLCIHQLFEEQVEKTPDAIALVFEGEQLTYRQLNAKANQVAHHLQSLGVGPEVLVGICVERSLEMLVGLLGILKAGGAYVPLDPTYPQQRLSFMLEDAAVSVLLTQQQLVKSVPKHQAQVVCLDTDWEEIVQNSESNPLNGATPNNLAYIIYTSGSTGLPKGVAVPHKAMNRLVCNTNYIKIDPSDKIAQVSNTSFDAATFEIWGALLHGAQLVGISRDVTLSPHDLALQLRQKSISILFLTTALFQQIARDVPHAFASLRCLLFGGEAVNSRWVKKVLKQEPPQQLLHVYGPTESTTFSSFYWVQDIPEAAASIPIGRPITSTQIYLLDKQLQPVPIGVSGELYIGGLGLAQGYFNRPDLTAQRFIPNPWSNQPGARLYRSGDWARYLSDGNIEYLGRIDQQVKIRGFRIELEEIEAVLGQYPNVREAVVIARADVPNNKRLVAYIVPTQNSEVPISSVRRFLQEKLPEYMVPSSYVVLDALPLTPNGKIDRRALPAPAGRPEVSDTFVAPRTPIEQLLADIWASVLRVERVGIHDNFFELGGDSILSIQIIAKANRAGVQLTPKQLFEHQTIARLAAVAGTRAQTQAQQGLVIGSLPLTPIQQWFFAQNFPEPDHWNQALLLEVQPKVNPAILQSVVQQLLVHHDALRSRFQKTGSNWQVLNAAPDTNVPFSCFDLVTLPEAEQTAAIEATAAQLQASLNLEAGPLVRVAFFALGTAQPGRLLIIIHHLAVDGVSWRILLEDLQTGYQQLSLGKSLTLPPKTTSFKDWAHRLVEYARSPELKSELDYWLRLAGRRIAALPTDFAEGANTYAAADTVSVSLSVDQTRALLQEVPKAYNTQINDVLLTALAQVLAQWTNSQSVLLNLEGHGREDIFEQVDLSRTVGWFTTMFPVLLEVETTGNSGEALKTVKEQLRAIPNKGIGYGLLRYLRGDEEIATQLTDVPEAEVSFNYLGQFDGLLHPSSVFQPATESTGVSYSSSSRRSHRLDISGFVVRGQLQIDWTYSQSVHRPATVERLAQQFVESLAALITHCLSPEAGGYTPSDFPLSQLSCDELERVLASVEAKQISQPNWKNIQEIYPLLPMQQGMLFHTLYAPSSGVYFEQSSCTLTGQVQVIAFEQAWQQVVARHEILRTGFIWESQSMPIQVVHRQVRVPLDKQDWRGLEPDEQQQQLEALWKSQRQQGFNLSKAPLMRLFLIQMQEEVYELVWCFHHILLDGWSLSIVLKEFLDLYEAGCQGHTLELPASRSYREYIAWLHQQSLTKAEAFWRQTLAGFTAPTALGVERICANLSDGAPSDSQQIELSTGQTEAIQAWARQQQLSVNTLVQGAWALLLSRYSGERDVVFGVTVSGRPPAIMGVESIVGLLINSLPLRVRVSVEEPVVSWLKKLQSQQVEISQYEYTPLVQVQGWSDLLPGVPLFDTLVVFENYPVDTELSAANSNLHWGEVRSFTKTNYPLTVVAIPGQQLSLRLNYDPERFEAATVARMLKHFQSLLCGIVANPQQPLSALPMLSAAERQQLLVEWNNAQADEAPDVCIHQLFEACVEETPEAVAVVFEGEELSYGQLNAKANQVAHHLRSMGVGAEVLVGICVERSLDMVVGLLGILKAGGAYVPLDPEYPTARLSFMLEDAAVSVLLTQQRLVERLPEYGAQLVCLDSDGLLISQSPRNNPITAVQASNLAYVIYTSGSTGQPKGAMNTHRGICNRLLWMQQAYQLTASDAVLQKTPFSFDVSVWEFFWTLIIGARLVIAKPEGQKDSAYLVNLIAEESITTLHFVPSMLQVFLEAPGVEKLKSLKRVICSGEALPFALQQSFFKLVDAELHNLYGPTEAAIDVTFWRCQRESDKSIVPIGRPISNTQIYLLDAHLQPVPIGLPGELHISGAGLARGYFNRPQLTASKFIPNPFSDDPSSRLYKTGDKARYLSDGNIEYLGRIDNQVKIRGFRIELGEIEAVVSQHPNVQASVVIAREDTTGEKRLVAYVVPHQQQTPTISELRQFLSLQLPGYMVPQAFVMLDALPLTPNGKVDRRALPGPSPHREVSQTFVAPRTPIEEMLALIWAQVLRIERVGIQDNFFELGGDSILSIQIIAKAKLAGLQLSIKQLFAHQTIAELATVAGTTQAIEVEQGLVTGTLPLTPIQHWFFWQNLPEPHHFNQSFLLSVPNHLQPELLEQVLQQLLVHHDALRLRFIESDLGWQAMHSTPTERVAFSFFDLSTRPETEQQAAIEAQATALQASLNLSENLVQVAYFWLGVDQPARLLIVIHHLVVDGVSWRILLEDLQTAYQQLSQSQAIKLPVKTTSFKDWAQRLTSYAQSDQIKAEVSYWLSPTHKEISLIPVDYTVGANTVASARTVSVSLNESQTRALLQDVPKAYNTQINDVLLTALVLVFGSWTSSNFVRFDLEGHGREDIVEGVDLSRTVGWFTTLFPVVLEREAIDNLGAVLKSVKEQLRAIPNKGIGYGLLRYLSQDAEMVAQLEALPQAEVSFNYLGQFAQVLNTSSQMKLARESSGDSQSLQGRRAHLLNINGLITGERLQINWTYSTNVHQPQTIEHLAQEFVQTLRGLIAHCLAPNSGGYTPSDFPLVKLTQLELDQVLACLALKPELGQTNWKNIQEIYPLLPMQQGMLFHTLYAPSSGVYFEQSSCTLTGQVQVIAFEQAWQQVVARHEILRTGFIWESQSMPIQVVHRQVRVPLDKQDWRGLEPDEQQQQLEALWKSQRQQGFNLSKAPLMRLFLIQMQEEVYELVWCFHHILLDGWSLSIVLKEFLDLYEAGCQGHTLELPASRSYREYIAWLHQQSLTKAEAFWRQTLAGFTAPTALGVERICANLSDGAPSDSQQIELSTGQTEAIQAWARQQQLSVNTLVQGAWALLLSRYSGERDVVFGVTVSGRPPAIMGVESIVGLLINSLPLRVRVSVEEPVVSWLKKLQSQQVEISQYEYTPLVQVQGWSDLLPGVPLFDTLVVFENYPVDTELSAANSNLHWGEVRSFTKTNYPLTVVAIPGQQLSLRLNYDPERFEAATIARMLGHFQSLLCAMVSNPQQPVSELPMLSAAERQQLLVEWNNTQADEAPDVCIHQLFEACVEETPEAVALVFEGEELSYGQLNAQANQVAHYLQSLGVGPEVLVGICVERSLEMVVGLLGILKAGGAYLPLDPDYPTERLSFMLEDAAVSVLLTQQHLVERLPSSSAQVVCLDGEWNALTDHSQHNPTSEATTANLAYVIYTSGSTGLPKGVEIVHRSLLNLVDWHQQAFCVSPTDRASSIAGLAFDASVWELWPYLAAGASIYIPNQPTRVWPEQLQQWLVGEGITIAFLPTPLAERILSLDWPKNLALRTLLTGGDKLHHYPSPTIPFEVVNNYGPTENTVVTTSGIVVKQEDAETTPSIGRPILNTQVYLLDDQLMPVPIGVPGELHIGGAGLARGYLNRPELTAEKFIPNPFDNSKCATRRGANKIQNPKLYKTGDKARYLSDGSLEYLGRLDNQVKIRGFRIELGEIEAVLSQHPNVQASVVIAREETSGDKRLVAYVVGHQQQTPTISELRQFLSSQLPGYMVPQAFVRLDTLPLTPNGKVDRRALPAPSSHREVSDQLVAPRTPIEEMLALIWAQVLRIERVGIHDNFFELGGDSILSIQIIAKAKLAGLQLSLKQLFAHPTIAELATVAGTTKAIEVEQGLVTGTLPLTPIQHWFFWQNLPEPHHFNQSFLLSVPNHLQPELLEQVLQQLLVHHDALRLRFVESDLGWQARHSAPTEGVAFSFFDLSTLPETEQQAAIEAQATALQASLNLSENLVQVAYFWLGVDQPARLLIVIHHLVVDGVSWRILLEDLTTAYQQLSQGQTIKLPVKTTSFKDWAQRLTSYAQSDQIKAEVSYWLSPTHKEISLIPVDYTVGANTVASARTVSVSLNESQTRALLQDVPKAYNTQINDVLLTALVLVFGSWTSSNFVRFDLEGHGREDIVEGVDLSRTVGWFTTLFPVVLEREAIDNLGAVLKSVKEQLRAIPNKGIGYGLLRYLSQDAEMVAQLEALPQAEVSFNYLGQFAQVLNTSSQMKLARESSGDSQSLQGRRAHLLNINGLITGERLQINWTYSTNVHQPQTIEHLAQEFVKTLRGLIAHCLAPNSGGYTPSDFPLVKLTQLKLDQVLACLALKPELGQTNWKNIEEIYPLSPMQQGMLFHSLYAPQSGVYFELLCCTLKGNLDVPAFEQAWQQVVARHAIFRTAFVWEDLSEPLQVVYRQVKVTVETHRWLELSVEGQQQQLEVFLESERQQGLPLFQAPLMRLNLIQLDTDTYQFVWSYHHLLLDGWSLPLVLKDILYFYQVFSQGKSLPAQPTASYRNYIAWLQKQDLAQAEVFWRQKLKGFSAPTPLSVDKPLSNRHQQQSSYSEQEIQLTAQLTLALQTFARQHQLTINNLVQASWALLLCRYSGETDVVFGATVSGRSPSLVGIESMVGLLINTLPVRVQVSPETELLGLLKNLQAQQVECEQYSYSSLVEIQGLSEVPRGTSLFESILVFENYPVDAAVQQDNSSFLIDNVRGIEQTNYPLTVVAVPGEQLFFKISYDTSRFDEATITRMLEHVQTLLASMVANPKQRIWQLPLLTADEQQQLLVEWNSTQVEYPQDKCIHQLFEAAVERTPDGVALVYENQQLTYHQLNGRANQLAHYLRSLGVGPEVLVGICVERSLDMVVGLLGILKTGGAYVPLDPDYPTERLSFMLEDAQVSVLLTQQQLVERLPSSSAQVVCLDGEWQAIACHSQHNPMSEATTANRAYVIYTSGSTGWPKGVEIVHRSLLNLVSWHQLAFCVSPTDRASSIAGLAFDASVWELWPYLAAGASIYIPNESTRVWPEQLQQWLVASSITIAFLPTPLAERILLLDWPKNLALRTLLTGGDKLHHYPSPSLPFEVVNNYGPTENTVVTTSGVVVKQEDADTTPSIGRPILNTQVYLLDSQLMPVPIGVAGEIYIGGTGLARGYLNRPELTASKFIPNPFSNDPDSRLYKTGDKARYLSDGNIEYLGRIDHQVKIRGFRIELGEIEAVLSQHPKVREAVVIAREDTTGEKCLVAYVVPHQQQTPTISELRQFLSRQLPGYMVPGAFVILESVPLTPNGKVDLRALPAADTSQLELVSDFVAPRDTLELQLAQIWEDVLNIQNIGVRDNFFDKGGHSLLAVRLMAQIQQEFKKELPLATLFKGATIEQLASILREPSDLLLWEPLVAIQPNGSKRPFFCVPGTGGNVLCFYNLVRHLGTDQPFYGLQPQGLDGEQPPLTKVEDIAAEYIQALQAVQPQGPYLLGGYSFGGYVAFEMATQLLHQGQEVALLAILDTLAPSRDRQPEALDFDDAKHLTEMALGLERLFGKNLSISYENLQPLEPDEQLNYLLERLKRVNIFPPDAKLSQLRGIVQVIKANVQTYYVPQEIYPNRITVLRASEQGSSDNPTMGWDKFSDKPIETYDVPGDHITMVSEPHVQILAQQLRACLEQAQADDRKN